MSAATSGVPTKTSFLLRSAGIGMATRSILSWRRIMVIRPVFFGERGELGGSTGTA